MSVSTDIDNTYILKAKTQNGFALESVLLLFSSIFNGSFKAKTIDHGLQFFASTEDIHLEIDLDGLDFRYTTHKPHNILNLEASNTQGIQSAKKRDICSISVSVEQPDVLVLKIADQNRTTSTTAIFNIVSQLGDLHVSNKETVVHNYFRYKNPIVIVDAGELCKNLKIITKATDSQVFIDIQDKGIMLFTEKLVDGIQITIGRYHYSQDTLRTHLISKQVLRSVFKFFSLSKQIRIYSFEKNLCFGLFLNSGLGFASLTLIG